MATWHGVRDWAVGEIPTAGHLNEFISDNMQWLYDQVLTKDGLSLYALTPASSSAYTPPGSYTDVGGMSASITAGASAHDSAFGVAMMTGTCGAGDDVLFRWAMDGSLLGGTAGITRTNGSAVMLATVGVVFSINSLASGGHTFTVRAAGGGSTPSVNRVQCSAWLAHVKRT